MQHRAWLHCAHPMLYLPHIVLACLHCVTQRLLTHIMLAPCPHHWQWPPPCLMSTHTYRAVDVCVWVVDVCVWVVDVCIWVVDVVVGTYRLS
jgi:hypothetical protein